MEIICSCGNKMELIVQEEEEYDDDEGQYVGVDFTKFGVWQAHDMIGIVCKKCDKAIWMFT